MAWFTVLVIMEKGENDEDDYKEIERWIEKFACCGREDDDGHFDGVYEIENFGCLKDIMVYLNLSGKDWSFDAVITREGNWWHREKSVFTYEEEYIRWCKNVLAFSLQADKEYTSALIRCHY